MSSGTNHPGSPIANPSFVLSESARRATARLSENPRTEVECVRRNLEPRYPREVESPNVVVEREFPFNNLDESLLVTEPTDPDSEVRREERQPRPRISRTPSNISLRREFSLTSYESEIFDPEEVYRHLRGEMSVARTPPEYTLTNAAADDADLDIPRQAARRLEQQVADTGRTRRPPRREEPDLTAILELLHEMRTETRTEIHSLHERIRQVENIHQNATHREIDNGNRSIAYGRSDRDIRHRRSTTPNCLSLKEARTMIPEFDGTSHHKLQEFLSASTYAINNIDPANEESLIQAILCTKLKGKAWQDFETREIQTFEELKQQLEACYQTDRIQFAKTKTKRNRTCFRTTRGLTCNETIRIHDRG